MNVTRTPESFPPGKLLPVSPTWPFTEVKSSSAADRSKTVLGQSSDNTSLPQSARTPASKTHHRTRAHVDFSSSLYQGSGHSSSLEPSKDSTESLVQPGPKGGQEAADVSGLPLTSMLPSLSTVPSGTSFSAVPPSQPVWALAPSISKHPPRSDIPPLLPPLPSSSLAPDSPHSIISEPAEQHPKVPLVPQTPPADPPSGQNIANPLIPFSDEMDHTVSQNAQDLIGIPHLGVSGSSTKWHSELSPTEGPHSAGSSTPGFLSPMAELSHPSPPPPALGSLPQLPDGSPTGSVLEVASDPASTQQTKAGMAGRVHGGVPLPTFKNTDTATHEAEPPLFQTAESGAVEMNSRKLAPDTANDSANPLHLSAAPENSRGPALSAEHTSSSLVPSPLHVTALGREQAILSEAVPTSPSTGTIDFPSVLTFLQTTENHASPSPVLEMPTLPAEGSHGSPPATRDLLLSGRVPNLSTSWTFPRWKKDSVTAILRKNEEANVTVPLQAFPRKEVLSLHTVNGFVSDFSTHHVSSPIVTAPRTNPLPSGSPLPSILSIQATQTVFPSLGFSNTKPEASAAAVDHSGLPASASKQVRAPPSSMGVYDSSTIGDMKKPATTDVFWSSLSAETGSLSTESIISGLQQQTNYDLNGHTISTTSWETHLAPTAPTAPPSGLTSAANAIKSQDFKDTAGHSVTAEGFSIQDLVLSTSTEQPVQQSDMTVVGSHVDLWPTSNNNHSIDFQTAEVAYYSPTTQHSVSQLQLPDQPAHPLLLTSSRPTSTGSLQEMLSDGTDTGSEISSDLNSSPERNASTPFQNILSYHSAAESSISTSVFPRTSSRVLRASQHPKKWTGAATNAGSLFPSTPKTGMTAFVVKASSSSTQIPAVL